MDAIDITTAHHLPLGVMMATKKPTTKKPAAKKTEPKKPAAKKTSAKKPKKTTVMPKSVKDASALITGFPGFITGRLVDQLMERQPKTDFTFLVQANFAEKAADLLEEKRQKHRDFSGNLEVEIGDISLENLGLADATLKRLSKKIGVIWHLAAIYNLAVPDEVAFKVNVHGTKNVLDFAESCTNFVRFNYISSCYVSGKRSGRIFEDELDEGQDHNNHYESTKFWAEMEVQRRWHEIPSVILRPSIVVGDSRTGETDKYDGPYYLLKLIHKMPKWLPFPYLGRGTDEVNIVPVDFLVEAAVQIGLAPNTETKVYQLADPQPMRASEIIDISLKALQKPQAKGAVPVSLVDGVMSLEKFEKWAGVPSELVEYFTHEASYDTSNADTALEGTGIQCPHLSKYIQALADYYERNPDKSFQDGRDF